jgi:hypothetical protein
MEVTKKTHFNPCFWTAHWNTNYLNKALKGEAQGLDVRSQRVCSLNVRGNKIFADKKVEDVHFEKNLGIARLTPEEALGFCRRHHPDHYDELAASLEKDPLTLELDFENVFTCLESSEAYTTLRRVIRTQALRDRTDRANLACFLVLHEMRNHASMGSFEELFAQAGISKFESLWMMKHNLGNPHFLVGLCAPLTDHPWHFYRTQRDSFPLCDSPILILPQSVIAALSPRLLLEIDRTKRCDGWFNPQTHHPDLPAEKLEEFRLRTIRNTFREIIFSDRTCLEAWQASKEFQERHQLLKSGHKYNQRVHTENGRELWKLNAHANSAELIDPKDLARSGPAFDVRGHGTDKRA